MVLELAAMKSNMKTLEQQIMQVLENHDGVCLDTEEQRQQIVDALFKILAPYDN